MQTLDEHTATQYVLYKHHHLESSQSDSVLQVVNDIVEHLATRKAKAIGKPMTTGEVSAHVSYL